MSPASIGLGNQRTSRALGLHMSNG
jgi:hypothetical protein